MGIAEDRGFGLLDTVRNVGRKRDVHWPGVTSQISDFTHIRFNFKMEINLENAYTCTTKTIRKVQPELRKKFEAG
jgi:hypothetical protein